MATNYQIYRVPKHEDEKGHFEDTGISLGVKPILVVGSERSRGTFWGHIGDCLSAGLNSLGIEHNRTESPWPRNNWHLLDNGVYLPNTRVYGEDDWVSTTLGNGGMTISGKDFCLVSIAANTEGKKSILEREMKTASGIDNIIVVDYLTLRNVPYDPAEAFKDIDTTIGYIPESNLFVFDKSHFNKRKRQFHRILDSTGASYVISDELFAPNFLVVDNKGTETVLLYQAPELRKILQEKGVYAIDVADARSSPKEFLESGGSIRCFSNTVHPEVLERMAIGGYDKLYDSDLPLKGGQKGYLSSTLDSSVAFMKSLLGSD